MRIVLKSHGEESEDRHVEAELCDRGMAEYLLEPAEMQDRPQDQNDDEQEQASGLVHSSTIAGKI